VCAQHLATHVAKDPNSNPTNSPTLYRTDRGSWLLHGFVVTDPEALTEMDIPEGESVVEIPNRMIRFFTEEGRWRWNGWMPSAWSSARLTTDRWR
jgi:hypothetical protein